MPQLWGESHWIPSYAESLRDSGGDDKQPIMPRERIELAESSFFLAKKQRHEAFELRKIDGGFFLIEIKQSADRD